MSRSGRDSVLPAYSHTDPLSDVTIDTDSMIHDGNADIDIARQLGKAKRPERAKPLKYYNNYLHMNRPCKS